MDDLGAKELWQIALTSGVVAALVNQIVLWIREHLAAQYKLKTDALFPAIRLIGRLERFAIECSQQISNNYEEVASAESHGVAIPYCRIPELTLPDEELAKLDKQLASQAEWIATERAHAEGFLNFKWEDTFDPHDFVPVCRNMVGYFGHRAIQCADNIRNKYDLPHLPKQWGRKRTAAFLKKYADATQTDLKQT